MKSYTIFLGCAILAMFLVRSSDAVACSTTILTNCTDCTDGANVDNADCTTTTTSTTVSTVTLRNNRRIIRISNLRYTNVRRIRVNRGGTTTSNAFRNNRRRGNVRVVRG